MQANVEEKLVPEFYSDAELTRDFDSHLKLDENLQDDDVRLSDDDDVSDEEEEEEEDFSFDCGELSTSLITAEDAFVNGQIKPAIPRLDRDLLYSLHENLPAKPPVKKIFVETNNGREMTSSGSGGDDIVGPYCEWSSRKVVEASPAGGDEVCKKSNSTGFSKIWRFRERVDRSNSDGRDTYVFLNNSGHAAAAKVKRKVKKSSKTASLSAHEVYLKSKAQGDERRRSYLPYRPELMGFFTNVNTGLTKNVHPF